MASSVLTPPKPKAPSQSGGRDGRGFDSDDFHGGRPWGSPEWSVPPRAYRTGMWMALAGISMIFAAFTSALVVRKGMGGDWVPTALPPVVYVNTLVLLVSSATLEISRRSLGRNGGLNSRGAVILNRSTVIPNPPNVILSEAKDPRSSARRFLAWWYVTLALGCTFIAGQLLAWRQLSARGVYLSTNPGSSFFYLLTAAHGLHVLGGIAALSYVALRARRGRFNIGKRTAVDMTALYWHFMDGLWIYLLFLLATRL